MPDEKEDPLAMARRLAERLKEIALPLGLRLVGFAPQIALEGGPDHLAATFMMDPELVEPPEPVDPIDAEVAALTADLEKDLNKFRQESLDERTDREFEEARERALRRRRGEPDPPPADTENP